MVSSIHILMLTVSSSASRSFPGLTNGKLGLSPDFFSLEVIGSDPSVRFLFESIAFVLMLHFILHIYVHIASSITVPQKVDWNGAG